MKVYTVRVNPASHNRIHRWYHSRKGQEFDTVLLICEDSEGKHFPAFKNLGQPKGHIYPEDCVIVAERLDGSLHPSRFDQKYRPKKKGQ